VVTTTEKKRHAARVVRTLKKAYPEAECSLHYDNPLQLLIATILSAQCTDKRVNLVTEKLFQKYRTAADFGQMPIATLEKAIKSTGFFRNKAKNIKACCQALSDRYHGEVPANLDDLISLAGVGRKTANVVLGNAFGIVSGVVVDTHVTRLSHRLGLSQKTNPEKIEADLNAIIPKNEWIEFSHRMIQHGRLVCVARRPRCQICSLIKFCPQIDVDKK
jgi:endonuclease-3